MFRGCGWRLAAPSAIYSQHVTAGKLRPCPKQEAALHHVDRLHKDLTTLAARGIPPRDLVAVTGRPSSSTAYEGEEEEKASGGFFSSFGLSRSSPAMQAPSVRRTSSSDGGGASSSGSKLEVSHPLSLTKGVYLHGDVGCGKTHLMDMLYTELPSTITKKRVHFHQFMQSVHKDMHRIKQSSMGAHMDGDSLMREVAKQQCDGAELLCFDELVVADVADAMILRRLFENMYSVGVCTIFTSNRPPRELYKEGLNRGAFMPFIDLLHDRCHVHDMSSGTDHRLLGTTAETYMHPVTSAKTAQFNEQWTHLTGNKPEVTRSLIVYGRKFDVTRSAGGVCRFTFRELCTADLSVADYSELAKSFHTVFLENVPRLPPGNSDTKRRFISLLDELYQYKCKLYILADAAPELLEEKPADPTRLVHDSNEESFYAGQLINAGEDKFQMRRAVSRLQEMRSEEYAKSKHTGRTIA